MSVCECEKNEGIEAKSVSMIRASFSNENEIERTSNEERKERMQERKDCRKGNCQRIMFESSINGPLLTRIEGSLESTKGKLVKISERLESTKATWD